MFVNIEKATKRIIDGVEFYEVKNSLKDSNWPNIAWDAYIDDMEESVIIEDIEDIEDEFGKDELARFYFQYDKNGIRYI